MDPCEELEADLDVQQEILDETKFLAGLRLFLGVIGFEWLYDLIKTRKFEWKTFLDALVLGDIAYLLYWLRELLKTMGLKDALKELGKKVGPWAIAIWAAAILINIGIYISRRITASDRFDKAVAALYHAYDNCDRRDEIFRERGIPIPR